MIALSPRIMKMGFPFCPLHPAIFYLESKLRRERSVERGRKAEGRREVRGKTSLFGCTLGWTQTALVICQGILIISLRKPGSG